MLALTNLDVFNGYGSTSGDVNETALCVRWQQHSLCSPPRRLWADQRHFELCLGDRVMLRRSGANLVRVPSGGLARVVAAGDVSVIGPKPPVIQADAFTKSNMPITPA